MFGLGDSPVLPPRGPQASADVFGGGTMSPHWPKRKGGGVLWEVGEEE